MSITSERLRELLNYDEATGLFRWKKCYFKNRIGTIAGKAHRQGYRQITLAGRSYLCHRLAWLYVYGDWPVGRLDHKDLCPDHNWISNLRLATQSQNCGNQRVRRNNKAGLKGVFPRKGTDRWRAFITKDGRRMNLGTYPSAKEAHAAYCIAAQQIFGEFAQTGSR